MKVEEAGRSVSTSPPVSLKDEIRVDPDGNPKANGDGSVHGVPEAGSERDDGEYPDGARMAFIVIALLLSIFLAGGPRQRLGRDIDAL